MKLLVLATSVATLAIALVLRPEWIWTLFLVGVFLLAVVVSLAALVVALVNYYKPTPYQKPTPQLDVMRRYLMEMEPKLEKPLRLPVIYGRMVDGILQQLMDLALRDYVGRVFSEMGFKSEELLQDLKVEIWKVIENIQQRLSHVDLVRMVAVDMVNRVTTHLEHVRLGNGAVLDPHLESVESEKEYLRRLFEHAVEVLFPASYSATPSIKHLLRELLVCKVLHPAIESLTDPDNINQKLLAYVKQQPRVDAIRRKSYANAASYEDYLRMIEETHDPELLKHIRYNIVTDILQATTMYNLKKSKGMDGDKLLLLPHITGKGEQLQARQLKRHISHLTVAKTQCERRLKFVGHVGVPVEAAVEALGPSLTEVLSSVVGRRYLGQYLESVGSQSLLGYWAAVEELRNSPRDAWHQLGAEIFYTYVNTPSPDIHVDKPALKRMEGFLLGDTGPEVFYEVQAQVVTTLEEKFYPSFLASEFHQTMRAASEEGAVTEIGSEATAADDASSTQLSPEDRTGYTSCRLARLEERLSNKTAALQALRGALKADSRVLSALEREVARLEGERRQLEAHLRRTEAWGEHLGRWRAAVQSADMVGDAVHLVLVVHAAEDGQDVSTGWVVLRKLQDFHELHRQLCQLSTDVRHLELPSAQALKFKFGKGAIKTSLDKAKDQIQKYLKFVLEDERLNQSEALYTFLSPSSDHLKQMAPPSPKRSRFSLTTLFKSGPEASPGGGRDSDEEDVTLLLDEGEVRGAMAGDGGALAEPLYALLGEVFDLRGLFKWMRRTLITFVQITYNRTINRQVHETVEWIFSEQMMYYYIKLFIKSWWPNGKLQESVPRTEEQRARTREEAREQFVANVPELLCNLVGQQGARRGAAKVFDTLQDPRLNKQLFYELLEVVVSELCPELNVLVVEEEPPSPGESAVSSTT